MNNEFLTDWGLTLLVFLPAAGALAMLLIPKAEEQAHKWVSMVAVLASAGMGVAVLADFGATARPTCSSSSTSRGSTA